jgi:hypothetical protein
LVHPPISLYSKRIHFVLIFGPGTNRMHTMNSKVSKAWRGRAATKKPHIRGTSCDEAKHQSAPHPDPLPEGEGIEIADHYAFESHWIQ